MQHRFPARHSPRVVSRAVPATIPPIAEGGPADLADCVYVDVETTGTDRSADEVLSVAIVGADGRGLLDTLIKPVRRTSWKRSLPIHGIAPKDVAGAPSLTAVAPAIRAAVHGRVVVAYSAEFEADFLSGMLDTARALRCCKLEYAAHVGQWDDWYGGWHWWSLVDAARAVFFPWRNGAPHNALADALACRAVWRYLHDPQERARVEAVRAQNKRKQAERNRKHKQRRQARQAVRNFFKQEDRRRRQREAEGTLRVCGWTGCCPPNGNGHWAAGMSHAKAAEEFCRVFFGHGLQALALLEKYPVIYRKRADIPRHLKPVSWFRTAAWYRRELRPCAAYVGKKQAYELYDRAEKTRLDCKFRLRLTGRIEDTETHAVVTRGHLRQHGWTRRDMDGLEPAAERWHFYYRLWYPLFLVPKKDLDRRRA